MKAKDEHVWPGPNSRNFRLPVGQGTTAEGINLRISLPAVMEEDITFSAEGTTLLLFGQRREPEGFGEVHTKRYGLPYGHFHQRVLLPKGLDLARLTGKFHHGVLDIHVPFAAMAMAAAVRTPRRRIAAVA